MLLPAADEIESRMMELEEADDMSALETYLRSVIPDYRKAYNQYQALSDKLKAHVQGFERVLDLEWLWSAFILYDYPALADDSAYVSDLTITKIAPQERAASGQQVSFTFSFDMLSYTDTNYGEGRVKIEAVLPYVDDQAAFDLAAMSWLDQTEGYAPSISSETRTIDGEETACQVLNGFVHLTTGEMDGYVIPGSFEGNLVVTIKELEHHAPVFVQISAAMEHGAWEGECTAHGRTEKLTAVSDRIEVYVPLTQEEQTAVDSLNEMIAALPMADEVEAVMTALDAADDMESLERYIRDHAPRFREAYLLYETLTDRQKEEITSFDKVLDLEWFWSAFILYDYPALEDDSARVSAITVAGSQEQVMLGDSLLFQFKADTESYTDTNYGEGRMKIEVVLPLSAEQATFDLETMTWLDRAEGYAPEIAGATCQIDGEETACQILTGFVHLTTGDLEGYAIPGSFEGGIVVKTKDLPHRHPVFVQLSAALEHSAWEDICPTHQAIEKHTVISNQIIVCVPPTPEEQVQIDALNALLSALPTVDDVELIINAFEAAGDMAGLEAYMREIVPQFREAYLAYEAMNERQKEEVVGFDKVLDLEWFWSAFILYDYPPLEDDSARVSSLVMTDVKPLDQAVLGEVISFGFKLNTESYTDTNYGEGRAKIEAVLPFDSEQAAYALDAMGWLDRTEGYAPVVTSETRVIDGAEMVCQVLTGFVYLTTGELQSYAIPGSFEGSIAVKTKELAHGTPVYVQLSAALEHGAWDGECPAHQSAEKHSAVSEPVVVLVPLTQEQLAQVDELNALIASLPTADDVELIINAFEGAGDLAGLEAYMREIVPQFRETYNLYQAMNDQQREAVVGFEKVLDLEWFWSAFILYDYPDLTDDSAYVSALTLGALSVETANPQAFTPEDTVKNGDAVRYPFTVSTESYTDTNYSEGRVKLEIVLPLSAEQAAFDLDAMTWLDREEGYSPEIAIRTRTIDGTETVCQILTGFVHMTTGSLDGYAIPGEFTHNVVVKLIAAEPGTHFALEISAAMEHAAWEDECAVHQKLEKYTVKTQTLSVMSNISAEDWERVQRVIELIAALPDVADVEQILSSLEGDETAYETYFSQVRHQCLTAYVFYEALSDELRELVKNRDRLFALEWLWSIQTLQYEDAKEVPVYQVNKYQDAEAITLVYDMSVGELPGAEYQPFPWWTAVIVEEVDGILKVEKIYPSGGGLDKVGCRADTPDGFVLLIWSSSGIPITMEVGDVVAVDFDYKSANYNASGLGKVYFYPSAIPKPDKNNNLGTYASADTSEIIEVNLYDYSRNINDIWRSNPKYPGFQYPGGVSYISDPMATGQMDFGDVIVADGTAAVTVNGSSGLGGAINQITNGANSPIKDTISKRLINGYPALADGTSLKYLFSDYKVNGSSINGLFRYNDTTGAYWFNSREFNAQYDRGSNSFKLYRGLLTSNYIMYPFGNFLPFNNINTQTTQASAITREYFLDTAAYAQYKYAHGSGDKYKTLADVLVKFVYQMDKEHGSADWNGSHVITKYFKLAPPPDIQFSPEDLTEYYNIDYDVPTDFFFGMDMKMEFMQPKGGLTGKDGKQPMEFYFTGDDDVWVYVDDVLFLDLSGIHRHVGGKIDFVKGVVEYYSLSVETGDVGGPAYETVKFSELVDASMLNEKGTFKDYSTHTFNFYYMERGSGSSVCRMNFNFPLLKENSIAVTKEISAGSALLGNPDFTFRIMNEEGTSSFVGANHSYELRNEQGNLIGNRTTDENGLFSIKAGQTAVFSGISENSGKYYVEELLDPSIFEQYGNVIVNGTATTQYNDVVVDATDFKGVKSPVMDIASGTTAFSFTNGVDESKLGSLEITKDVEMLGGAEAPEAVYRFKVLFDGENVPVGTAYTVVDGEGSSAKSVSESGVIEIAAGETAVFSGILAGTTYKVEEIDLDERFEAMLEHAEGVIPLDEAVELLCINKEIGAEFSIPVTKRLSNTDGQEYAFVFELVRLDENKQPVEGSKLTKELKVSAGEISDVFAFNLSANAPELESLPSTLYYRLSELNTGVDNIRYDAQSYVVKVVVDENLEAVVTDEADQPIAPVFVNTLVRPLKLSKTIEGSVDESKQFQFDIILMLDDKPLSGDFTAQMLLDGVQSEQMLTFDEQGKAMIMLGHQDEVTILGLPIGTSYTIMESNNDGYWPVIGSEKTNMVSGEVTVDGAEVAFRNITTYALPESGGRGATLLYIAGALLTMVSAALLYIHKRRKEESTI